MSESNNESQNSSNNVQDLKYSEKDHFTIQKKMINGKGLGLGLGPADQAEMARPKSAEAGPSRFSRPINITILKTTYL